MNIMTIEDEIELLIPVLLHPAGFDIDLGGTLCIRPIYEQCSPEYWEVDWEQDEDGMRCQYHKTFSNLREATTFFVEKRRYMCSGLDFESILMKDDKENE